MGQRGWDQTKAGEHRQWSPFVFQVGPTVVYHKRTFSEWRSTLGPTALWTPPLSGRSIFSVYPLHFWKFFSSNHYFFLYFPSFQRRYLGTCFWQNVVCFSVSVHFFCFWNLDILYSHIHNTSFLWECFLVRAQIQQDLVNAYNFINSSSSPISENQFNLINLFMLCTLLGVKHYIKWYISDVKTLNKTLHPYTRILLENYSQKCDFFFSKKKNVSFNLYKYLYIGYKIWAIII